MGKVVGRSLTEQKVITYFKLAERSEGLWNSVLVFLGSLFLLSAIPFYPLPLALFIAMVCGIVAFKYPSLGLLIGFVMVMPALAYQSTILAWIGLLLLAIVLFEMFDNWGVIALLEIVCLAPFAAFPLSMFSGFIYLFMIWGSLHFGSRKSVIISVPAVLLILLLSSIWLVDNSAFFPITKSLYEPGLDSLTVDKPAVGLGDVAGSIGPAFANAFNLTGARDVFPALGKIWDNLMRLIFMDFGLFQILVWAGVLYLVGWLPAQMRGKRAQAKSASALLLVPILYFAMSIVLRFSFQPAMAFYAVASVAVVAAMDFAGLGISREKEIRAEERMKSYGKLGIEDLRLGAGEKSLDDVGGYEDVKKELKESIIIPLEEKELVEAYGLKPPAGILLFGPPGTGKTMLMRALAKELGYGFDYIKTSEILSMWYGESEKNVAEIFTNARKKGPSIVFFDEIDAIGKKRTADSMDDVGPRVLSSLLQEMDGYKGKGKPVIVVGATNVPNKLDPALMRPGRFDKIIYMHLPDYEARKAIFKVHLSKIPTAPDVDLNKLAKMTERYSGADIKNVVTEALNAAAQQAMAEKKIVPVSMAQLLNVLNYTKPSTTFAQLEDYDEFKVDFERSIAKETKPAEKEEKKLKWSDVADLEDVKGAFREAIEIPLLHPELMEQYKVRPSRGILMFGPPGCGKTLVVKAAADEMDITFLSVSGAQLMKQGYGHAVNVIKDTFNRARENTPAVVFVDEIETIAPSRESGRTDIVGQFLTEMDGLKELKGVVVVGATNRPALLDAAILRPGRFDKIFYVHPPDVKGREQLFSIHLGEFAKGLDVAKLARLSEGFSGADIASLAQEVKMHMVRERIAGREPKLDNDKVFHMLSLRRPSITREALMEYESFMREYGERH
ncbi:AAA family ATPase [Candidatus Micrarchaeota archaeon]|nr:AAA family ATPase [Candidatus Micrarchaeota archaeon]